MKNGRGQAVIEKYIYRLLLFQRSTRVRLLLYILIVRLNSNNKLNLKSTLTHNDLHNLNPQKTYG